MALDRVSRDQLADALAAFLRSDIDEAEFFERLAPLEWLVSPFDRQEKEDDDRLLAECGDAIYGGPMGPAHYTRAGWDKLCRCLVYLDTNREYVRPDPPTEPWASGELRSPRTYRLHALGFATSFVMLFFEGWWPLLSWWVVSFILIVVVGHFRESRQWAEWLARNPPPPDFSPFRDETDWRANEWRLQRFRIPAYDPDLHGKPELSRPISIIGWVIGITALVGIVAMVVGLMLLFWPLTVISGCFDQDQNDSAGADKS